MISDVYLEVSYNSYKVEMLTYTVTYVEIYMCTATVQSVHQTAQGVGGAGREDFHVFYRFLII